MNSGNGGGSGSGGGSGGGGLGMMGMRASPFTVSQWQELEHQALIFKYMVAGLPVPPDLVLPIQKSFESISHRFFHHPNSKLVSSNFIFSLFLLLHLSESKVLTSYFSFFIWFFKELFFCSICNVFSNFSRLIYIEKYSRWGF